MPQPVACAPMTSVAIDDTQLHYERGGTGEPLLMVMGMGGTAKHWGGPFTTLIERDFDALRYDHRGIGASGRLEGELTIARLAADALALLDALELERVHVLGISMGGMVAQELTLRAPERVATLTLGCTWAGGPNGRFTDPEVGSALREATLSGDPRHAIRTAWEFNFSERYRAEESRFDAFYELVRDLRAPVPVLAAQAVACATHDTSARLEQVSAPTLVVHGTEDRILDAANATAIASAIPQARLELLPGVGHMFFWEQPERCAQLVRDHAALAAEAS